MTLLPPPEYSMPPSIPVIEEVMPWDEVQVECIARNGTPPDGKSYKGCGKVIEGTCYIWRVNDRDTQLHEYGHCNGWGYDHPNAVDNSQYMNVAGHTPVWTKPPKVELSWPASHTEALKAVSDHYLVLTKGK